MSPSPYAQHTAYAIASGTNVSDTMRIPRADLIALHFPAMATGSLHAFSVQAALVNGRDAPTSAQFFTIRRAIGSLMSFTQTAGGDLLVLSPDAAPFDALRLHLSSAALATVPLTLICKSR